MLVCCVQKVTVYHVFTDHQYSKWYILYILLKILQEMARNTVTSQNIPQVVFVHWADNFLQVYSIFSTPLLSMYKWTIKLQYEAKTGLFSVNWVIAQWEFMELDIELLHTTIIKKFNPEVFLDSCPGSSVLTTFIYYHICTGCSIKRVCWSSDHSTSVTFWKKKQSDKELNPKSTGNVDMAKYKKEK